jgi:hypothetical protein
VASNVINKMISLGVLLVLCLSFIGLGTTVVNAWTQPTLAISGDKVTGSPGDTVNIQVKIMNSDSSDVQLTTVDMSIWWNGTPTAISLSGSMVLPSFGETTLYGSFVVPEVVNGTYFVLVTITGKTSTDSSTTTYNMQGGYTVKQSFSGTTGANGINSNSGSISPLLLGGIGVIIVIVLAITLVRSNKKKSRPPQTPPSS